MWGYEGPTQNDVELALARTNVNSLMKEVLRLEELLKESERQRMELQNRLRFLNLPDHTIGRVLGIKTGCCHYNDNGWCLDHKGGRDISNYCTEAHRLAKENL